MEGGDQMPEVSEVKKCSRRGDNLGWGQGLSMIGTLQSQLPVDLGEGDSLLGDPSHPREVSSDSGLCAGLWGLAKAPAVS